MASSVRTLLFTDVEGSTSLLQRAGDGYADLIGRHRVIMRQAIVDHGGVEHGTEGDSFFVSFASSSSALAAAVQMQRGLHAETWPADCTVRVRMGAHIGEVSDHPDGPVGLAIHHAARVAAAAHGGQLIVSDDLRRLGVTLPANVDLKPLGDHRLRDLGTIGLYQVVHPDLPADFPPLRAMPSSRSNLPSIDEPLIGQDQTVDELIDVVGSARLLTLTGTGGVGKTRLAIEVGRRLIEQYDDGAWLLELAPVSESDAVVATLCSALSIPVQPDLPLRESMVDWLRGRSMLLVIDNCEHVVTEVAELVMSIMDSCPGVRMIATSREPLGVRGEQVHRVASLEVERAVELFVERMVAADRTAVIAAEDHDVLVDICQRLDGIPLAIQLAAARARSLSLVDLLDRLADRFRLLRGGARGARDRHQTLQATVTWSYQLLSADERLVFDRASVFAGGFDLDAAEHVCAGAGIDELDVVDLLHGLVDKSMLSAERTGSISRYRLLETLRQYGEDRLNEHEELGTTRDRHLEWYTQLARTADSMMLTSQQVEGTRIFASDWDNIRAAQSWAMSSEQLGIAADLVSFCFRYSANELRTEHCDWLDRLIDELPDSDSNMTRLLGQASSWRNGLLGDDGYALELAERGIRLAVAPHHVDTLMCWAAISIANDDVYKAGYAGLCAAIEQIVDLDAYWWSLIDAVDACQWLDRSPEESEGWIQRLRQTALRVRCPSLDQLVHVVAGHALMGPGPPDGHTALKHYLDALDIARRNGDTRGTGSALRAVATATCLLGEETALLRCVEALDHLVHIRYWQKAYQTLDAVAYALAAAGHLDDAAVVIGFLEGEIPHDGGVENGLGFRRSVIDQIQRAPNRDEMLQRGAAMTRDEVATFVMHESAARLAT